MLDGSHFTELKKAIKGIRSLGFNTTGGQIFLFENNQQIFERISLSAGNNITAQAIDVSDQVEISNYVRWMLEIGSGWRLSFPQQLLVIPGISNEMCPHISLQLAAGATCLAIFPGKQTESPESESRKKESLSLLLELGLNHYLQNRHVQELEKTVVQVQTELSKFKLLLEDGNSAPTAVYNEEADAIFTEKYGEAMQRVGKLIAQVAFSNSTVLILGETGTGKELTAKAVHRASPRKNEIMVKVNCAALPVSLIESELFGHERGSFTGAVGRHIGKFELAENGTLFLDEIGEIPLPVQAKLLRTVQERVIERIGGNAPIKVNVRIIAATNRNLNKEVTEGRFRADLFYRLNVFPIPLPCLRDRKEDIGLLANQFIKQFARAAGKKEQTISDKAIQQMMSYHWPGNVRELEHLIERTVLVTNEKVIRRMELPPANSKTQNLKEAKAFQTIEENEREHILLALRQTKGKIYGKGGAAELLAMNFNTLNSRIRKLGIQKAVIASVPVHS